ncbi:MAG: DUF6069 family protein [Chloroflexota bacterium]
MSRNIWMNVLWTIVFSIVLNVIVYYAGVAFGVSYRAEVPGGTVGLVPVMVASLLGAVIGCIGYWVLGFIFGDNRRVWFIWLATILGALSMLSPWFGANDLPTMGFLGIMHVVSVLVMTWFLGVWTPRYVTPDSVIVSS